jgi:CcmD family protein
MSNWAFVTLAYGLTWVVVAGYLVFLARTTARARATMAAAVRAEGGR